MAETKLGNTGRIPERDGRADGEPLLEVKDLVIQFRTKNGLLRAVDHVSFEVKKGEILGIVGESGCGKSVTSLSILGLNPPGNTVIPEGEILFSGKNLLELKPKELRGLRGKEISIIFQDSLTGLDPVMPIGKILTEAIRAHDRSISRGEARRKGIRILESVGIPSPEKRMKEYAHQLSGGMRQRVMIGLSLINDTKLLIADEPTTALDVTIQAQILELMKERQKAAGNSIILITHDMGVVAETADRIAVMYAGRIVESGTTKAIFNNPLHPYTQGLLKAIPRLNQPDDERLFIIEGTVPPPGSHSSGCPFADRCPYAADRCRLEAPPRRQEEGDHTVSCFPEYGRKAQA